MDLNHVVISIYQKLYIQTKAVQSVLKGKSEAAGGNVHATLNGTANSVFMTEFDSSFFKILYRMDIIIFYLLEFPAVSLN